MLGNSIRYLGNKIWDVDKRDLPNFLSTLLCRECECTSLSCHVVPHNFPCQLSLLPLTSNANIVGFEPSIEEDVLQIERFILLTLPSESPQLIPRYGQVCFESQCVVSRDVDG